MDKNFKNIDDLFKSEMKGAPVQAPDFVKQNIDAKLGFSKRRKYLLFFLIFIPILSSVSLFYFSQQNESSQLILAKNQIDENKRVSPTPLTTIYQEVEEGLVVDSMLSKPVLIKADNSFLTQNKTEENRKDQKPYLIIPDNKKVDIPQQNSALQYKNKAILSKKKTALVEENVLNQKEINPSNDKVELQNEKQDIVQEPKPLLPQTDSLKAEVQTDELPKQDTTALVLEQNPLQFNIDSTLDTPINIPTETNKPWMLSWSNGVNLTKSVYKSKDSKLMNDYQMAMQDKIGFESNIDLSYRFKNGLTLGTGLGYSNFKEKFDFSQTKILLDSVQNINYEYSYEYETAYTYDTSGVIIDSSYVLIDSVQYPVDSSYTNTTDTSIIDKNRFGQNSVSYFSIPVHFGTQIIMNNFQFDLFASMRMNFLLAANGTYKQNGEYYEFTRKNNPIYKPFYIDFTLGSKVHYNFYKQFYINADIRFRPMIKSTLTATTFDKRYHYTFFGLGLSWRL